MRLNLSRRTFVAGLGASVSFPAFAASPSFAAIEARIGGRLGVSVIDTRNGARIAYRGGDRFAMCSTFKWLLAAAVLARVDRGLLALDRVVFYGLKDMLDNAPVTAAHLSDGALSVGELCQAAVEVSDNTAANLLLPLVGNPAGLTQFARNLGDGVTRLDRAEPDLNANEPGDPRDTTTPDAMAATLRTAFLENVLSPASRDMLVGWMRNSRTGAARLRAGFPADWIVADKTGSGDNGAVNDVALAFPPGRLPLIIACYMNGSPRSTDELNAAHADVARIIAGAFV